MLIKYFKDREIAYSFLNRVNTRLKERGCFDQNRDQFARVKRLANSDHYYVFIESTPFRVGEIWKTLTKEIDKLNLDNMAITNK